MERYTKFITNRQTAYEFFKFSFVGITAPLVYLLFLYLYMQTLFLEKYTSVTAAYISAMLYSFALNNWFTFRHKNVDTGRLVRYISLTAIHFFVFFALSATLVEVLGIHITISSLVSIALASLFSFLASKFWVFAQK